MKYTPPFKNRISLNTEQWQQARAMWRQGKDTHDIALALGCTEAHIYKGIAVLKLKGWE